MGTLGVGSTGTLLCRFCGGSLSGLVFVRSCTAILSIGVTVLCRLQWGLPNA